MKSSTHTLSLLFFAAAASASPSPPDRDTLALWLFDETPYPNCILADSGPFEHDLRLTSSYTEWYHTDGLRPAPGGDPLDAVGGMGTPPELPLHVRGETGLVTGKFGNGLYTPPGDSANVVWPDRSQRYGDHVYMSDRDDRVPERLNLGYLDFTIEFWFRAAGPQEKPGVVFELRNEEHPSSAHMVNAILIESDRRAFRLTSRTLTRFSYDLDLEIPTEADTLNDGRWHHLAFTYTADERQMRHYVDGRLQPLPEKGCFLPTQNSLESLDIGRDTNAVFDEFRISSVVRYDGPFDPPGSFSRRFSAPRAENRPNGPPLLFDSTKAADPVVELGSRKHLFIDDVLLESMDGLHLRPNPVEVEVTEFRNTEPWEPTPRFGSTIPDPFTIWKEDGLFKMIYSNGGMWGARHHAICYAYSEDGIHWTKPELGLKFWEGDTRNNIVLRNAAQGSVIIDRNPNAPPEERYKLVAWNFYWGFFVFTSPDGIHWRRGESAVLPFDPDGSNTTFWDDQLGRYRTYIRATFDKRNPFPGEEPGTYRAVARLEIPEIMEPWPFEPVREPNIDLLQAKPNQGELPLVDTAGQVYRMKAHKYEEAPDTYLAFPWRYIREGNIRPGSFLMTSRDGVEWTRYEDPYYFSSDWSLGGREVAEALTEHGLVRQGDEIWQFGTVRFTVHGGILYGGEEREGGVHDRFLILKQRLDGFVSLEPQDGTTGVARTRPLRVRGDRLELNIDAQGQARVAILDASGRPFPGFGLEDSDPIRVDDVRHTVTWNGKSDLGWIGNKTVRLEIQLDNARLYALQFTDRP